MQTPEPREVAKDPDPIAYVPQAGLPEARFGAMDAATAAAISDAETATGFNLTGAEFYVFAVIGSQAEQLLVLDIDTDKAQALTDAFAAQDASRRFLQAIVNHPGVTRGRISRFVVNFNGSDKDGPYTIVVTAPIAILQASARGEELTQEQNQQVLMQLKRGTHQ